MTINKIEKGMITSAKGFFAGATIAGLKNKHHFDLGMVFSASICKTAGMFTTNLIKSSCVVHSQKVIKSGKAQAIVVNSGCANTCTGKQGMTDVREMARLTANKLGINAKHVVVANTGVIGITLPMRKISSGIKNIELTEYSGTDFASAIMTTDTIEKEIALSVEDASGKYIIAGVAKGAGMIHPNMATMLCFITTDANINGRFLQMSLKKTVDSSFNMISVDGDTSTNDMVILLSNGLAGNQLINNKNGGVFIEALNTVCQYLAKEIIKDGEGATKFIDVIVENARTIEDARLIARAITSSSLVKTAIYGNDPNWGRIIAAVGRSGAEIVEDKLVLYLNNQCVFKSGKPQKFDEEKLSAMMVAETTITIKLNVNRGKGMASAWGCDLSKEYVTINSAYTT
jgi:glutamate N-acetyltransferase / amino-acid N-acetyltransferase